MIVRNHRNRERHLKEWQWWCAGMIRETIGCVHVRQQWEQRPLDKVMDCLQIYQIIKWLYIMSWVVLELPSLRNSEYFFQEMCGIFYLRNESVFLDKETYLRSYVKWQIHKVSSYNNFIVHTTDCGYNGTMVCIKRVGTEDSNYCTRN